MTNYKPFLTFIAITLLFLVQLHTYQHWQYTTPNILLMLYIHTVYHQKSCIAVVYLASVYELMSFIQTGLIGLATMLLIPLSLLLKNIKKYFHSNIIAPCLIITLFYLLHTLCLHLGLHIAISWTILLQQIFINCIGYVVITSIKT